MQRCAALLALCSVLLLGLASCGAKATSNNPNTVVMVGADFAKHTITITQGQTITFLDDSDTGGTHILVVGKDGQAKAEKGAQDFGGIGGHRMESGDVWTTAPWTTPGTFHVACTVHPMMNLTITVLPKPVTTPTTSPTP